MLRKNLVPILFLIFISIKAQTRYETFHSDKLGEDRELKIQLPRGYNDSSDTTYPLFIVWDGDYLFEPVAGNVDYYAYWEDMPGAIVVGINQYDLRYDDCTYSAENSLPMDKGAKFFEFIGLELIPYLEKTYRLANFRVAIGHDETANFINYYLLKDNPVFNGYIVLSPELAPDTTTYLSERLPSMEKKIFYYLSTSDNDVAKIREKTQALDASLKAIDNKNFHYTFNNFEGPSHYGLPAHSIPNALESIFQVYQPISKKEYQEVLLKLDGSPVEYLVEKYATIEELFGFDKQVSINDFKAVAATIEKTEKFGYYEELGKLARKQYPETLLGNYYLARFYEETGEPKKAMKTYQSAYVLKEIGGFTKDMMLERADAIKADFGY
ncbi:MAG: alpha/beta hydrolase-fold protein [Flavobacteriaceae bacterium]|nr:esterase [Mangrovimonas sp.]MCB0470454.1 esterase [Flavobacteriaceae bacterium]MCB0432430.1 esterase [Mangrovimonas sp.]MCB0435540.1 esterase [Mangrovimonas sp.]MCB0437309.1 esterase [Mangrovimonas sp.]